MDRRCSCFANVLREVERAAVITCIKCTCPSAWHLHVCFLQMLTALLLPVCPQVHEKSLRHPEVFEVQGLAHHRNVIHAVAAAGNAPVLRCLLKCAQQLECSGAISKGVKQLVNARGTRGQTPLMLAAANAGGAECVKLLLEAGADPWAADICGGRTALFFAACENAVDSAALLLEATQGQKLSEPTFPNGPDTLYINMRMLAGFTALHVAVVADAQAIVRVMLRYGPRLSTPTLLQSYDFIACTRGTTPLHLAARHGRANIAKMILLAHVSCSEHNDMLATFGCICPHYFALHMQGFWTPPQSCQLHQQYCHGTAPFPCFASAAWHNARAACIVFVVHCRIHCTLLLNPPPCLPLSLLHRPTCHSAPATPWTPASCLTTLAAFPATWPPSTSTASWPACCSLACPSPRPWARSMTSTSWARHPSSCWQLHCCAPTSRRH